MAVQAPDLAGALGVVLAVVVMMGRMGDAPPAPIRRVVVQLTPEGPGRPAEPPRALRGDSSIAVPDAVRLQVGRARVLAHRTGQPQTIALRISPAEYDALLEELAAHGTVQLAPPGQRPGAEGDDAITLSLTLVPAGRNGEAVAPSGGTR